VPWPRFVLNNLGELVSANRAAQDLWRVDLSVERRQRSPAQLNLLSIAGEGRFAERIANWDECVATLIGVLKGRPDRPASLTDPAAYLQEVLAEFVKHDGPYLPRLLDLWAATPAREAKCHWSYTVRWHDPAAGLLHFHGLVSTVNEVDALGMNDWIPLGAATWRGLEQIPRAGPAPGKG
jgi:hypothetical protein